MTPLVSSARLPFQPTPYEPSAKIPTRARRTRRRRRAPRWRRPGRRCRASRRTTRDSTTMTPAMMPITAAAHGCTNAHGAVIATRPASMPLAIIPGSGFFVRIMHPEHRRSTAPNAAAMRGVHRDHREPDVGRREGRRGVEAEPAEQQDERAEHRHRDVVRGEHARFAVGSVLADAGPRMIAPARPATPPIMCTTPEPAKST